MSFPLSSERVLLLPNGPLDKECPWPAGGYHSRAESLPRRSSEEMGDIVPLTDSLALVWQECLSNSSKATDLYSYSLFNLYSFQGFFFLLLCVN